MANFTGANVITASDVTKYQPDVFDFGIASGSTEATNYFAQTTNDILRQLKNRMVSNLQNKCLYRYYSFKYCRDGKHKSKFRSV